MKAESMLSKFNYAGIIWILAANLVLAFILEFLWPSEYILAGKDLVLLLLLLCNVIWLKTIPKRFVYLLLPLLIYLMVLLFQLNDLDLSVFASLRQMLVPFLIILLGWYIGKGSSCDEVSPRIKEVSVFLLVGSLLFYILAFTSLLPIDVYSEFKAMQLDARGLPLMFGDSLTGGHIRNVSTFLDPVNLGHAALFLLVYGFYRKTLSKLLLILLLIAMLLTVCKGAFLQLAMVIFAMEFKWIPRWLRFVLIMVGLSVLLFVFQWHPGVQAHTDGLMTAVKHMSLFGEGIATVGNQAVLYGDSSILPIYDTFIGSILGQIGMVGLILWLIPLAMIMDFKKAPVLSTILLTQLIIAAVSENAFNFLSVFLLLLMFGIHMAQDKTVNHVE